MKETINIIDKIMITIRNTCEVVMAQVLKFLKEYYTKYNGKTISPTKVQQYVTLRFQIHNCTLLNDFQYVQEFY